MDRRMAVLPIKAVAKLANSNTHITMNTTVRILTVEMMWTGQNLQPEGQNPTGNTETGKS